MRVVAFIMLSTRMTAILQQTTGIHNAEATSAITTESDRMFI